MKFQVKDYIRGIGCCFDKGLIVHIDPVQGYKIKWDLSGETSFCDIALVDEVYCYDSTWLFDEYTGTRVE